MINALIDVGRICAVNSRPEFPMSATIERSGIRIAVKAHDATVSVLVDWPMLARQGPMILVRAAQSVAAQLEQAADRTAGKVDA